jgi:hypothetical protein
VLLPPAISVADEAAAAVAIGSDRSLLPFKFFSSEFGFTGTPSSGGNIGNESVQSSELCSCLSFSSSGTGGGEEEISKVNPVIVEDLNLRMPGVFPNSNVRNALSLLVLPRTPSNDFPIEPDANPNGSWRVSASKSGVTGGMSSSFPRYNVHSLPTPASHWLSHFLFRSIFNDEGS